MNLDNLPTEQADLAKDLLELGISEDEIIKGLGIEEQISTEKQDIEKSIDEQISEKQSELNRLTELKNLEKSNSDNLGGISENKFEELTKSLNDKVEGIELSFSEKFNGLIDLVKSLTDTVDVQNNRMSEIKEENAKLSGQNEELKKSLSGAEEVLNKIAQFSPGLKSIKSLSGASAINRFEKSENGGNQKETLSISTDKNKISALLSQKMDDENFRKSFANDVTSFEVSSKVSQRLEKAVRDELNIELTF